MSTSVIHSAGRIGRKSEVTSHYGRRMVPTYLTAVLTPHCSALSLPRRRPCHTSRTQKNARCWRQPAVLFPRRTMAVVEVHGAFFPIVSWLCWSASSVRLWMDTESRSTASVAADTFMRAEYWWLTCGGHGGRKEDKLSPSKAVCREIEGYCRRILTELYCLKMEVTLATTKLLKELLPC